MNREDIIRMARQVGFPMQHPDWQKAAEEFSALVAEAEREVCAKVCDFEVARLNAIDEPRPALAVGICAAAIRARGQQ